MNPISSVLKDMLKICTDTSINKEYTIDFEKEKSEIIITMSGKWIMISYIQVNQLPNSEIKITMSNHKNSIFTIDRTDKHCKNEFLCAITKILEYSTEQIKEI